MDWLPNRGSNCCNPALRSFVGKRKLIHGLFVPTREEGLLDFMLESAFAMLIHHAPTQYKARAARQWIPPSIPPEQLASGSRRQWILPSIQPKQLASGSRPVSRQSCSPVSPAEYPARAACQWITVDLAKYPSEYPRVARQYIPPSIPPE